MREVHAWANAGDFAHGKGRPKETPPVPAGFNWDLWLGPREARPYHPAYAPFNWRGWWAFGGGGIPDIAPHHLDPAFNALHLDTPATIEATGPGDRRRGLLDRRPRDLPLRPRASNMPPVTVYWYDGGLRPPTPAGIDPDDPKQRMGEGPQRHLLHRREGHHHLRRLVRACRACCRSSCTATTSARPRPCRASPATTPTGCRRCKGGTPASSNFDYASRLTEFTMLGCVALRSRKQLKWDGPNMKATNAPQADQYLKEPYRAGWELPL